MTSGRVGRALKSKKLTPRFIGPYQILQRMETNKRGRGALAAAIERGAVAAI
ncbi:hypothetical protein A2U01_0045070 [Trifolium medium]|uniref:Tf2-1-like SH3-like domain-containing protein n=1 Tax=Trifolium medium TaxID=97028 RepID=A0A392QJ02_9FABA|nr:hypothetical protein [Trifolium medium]